MAEPLIQNEVPDDYWARQGANVAPVGTADSMSARFGLAASSGLTGQAIDAYNVHDLDSQPNQRTLSVPELNEKYNGSGVTWTEPKKERVAEYIARAHQYKADLASRIERGDGGIIGSMGRGATTAYTFLGGADPLGLAAGITGGTAFRATGILAGEGLGTALARGAAEGAAVMTPLEAASVAHDRMMENDVNLGDSLKNIGLGSMIGIGVEGGLHSLAGAKDRPLVKGLPDLPERPEPLGTGAKPEHNELVVDVAARQMEEGLKPNVKPLVDLYERQRQDMGVKPESDYSGRSNYSYVPTDTSNPVSAEFFHGNDGHSEDFRSLDFAANVNSPDSFGSGIYANDNAMKANGYAEGGLVHSLQTKDAKLFPVDDLGPAGTGAIVDALKSPDFNMGNFAAQLVDGKLTAREVYNNLTEAGKDKMNGVLRAAGFDGLHFEDSAKDGTHKSNGVMMFDQSKVTPTGSYNTDPSLVSGLTEAEKEALTNSGGDPSRELNYDGQREDAIKQLQERANKLKPDEQSVVDTNAKVAESTLQSMDQNGLLTDAHKKEWDAINEAMDKRAKDSESIVQSLFDCIMEH